MDGWFCVTCVCEQPVGAEADGISEHGGEEFWSDLQGSEAVERRLLGSKQNLHQLVPVTLH